MNPKHSSESVLMVVAVISILIVACALFIAFGPASPRNQTYGNQVGRNTIAPYDMTQKEQQLAAALTGDDAAEPEVYRTDDDDHYQTITMGYDRYRHGKKMPGSKGLILSMTKEKQRGLVSVVLSGDTVRYTVSNSSDSISTGTKALALDTDHLRKGLQSDEVDLSGARKIRKGQKIYLKTLLTWKGARTSSPDAQSIAKKPQLVKDYNDCYLFYIQFR